MTAPVLSVRDLSVSFRGAHGRVVRAVDAVSFDVDPGETLAIVGESGSGKSVTALSILRLVPQPPGHLDGGSIHFKGENLLALDDAGIRAIRGNRIAMIFQEPMSSLNPVLTVGMQVGEPIREHRGTPWRETVREVVSLLGRVAIPDAASRLDSYPHQYSGGMRQRVMIAMSLAMTPELIIADEPTTALDVTVQAQILALLKRLTRETGAALILITHDLGVVARYADRVAVMYAGRIVETAPARELYARPRHPYTRGLLDSVPRLDSDRRRRLVPIEGQPPDLGHLPAGCAFAPRCSRVMERCLVERPALEPVAIDTTAPASPMSDSTPSAAPDEILRVEDLQVHFPILRGVLQRQVGAVKAVDGVSFRVRRGETLGLVGESGCGKSTTALAVLRMLEPTAGRHRVRGPRHHDARPRSHAAAAAPDADGLPGSVRLARSAHEGARHRG